MNAVRRLSWHLAEAASTSPLHIVRKFRKFRNAALVKPAHFARAAVLARVHARKLGALRARLGTTSGREAPALIAISLIEHMGDIVAAEPISRTVRRMYPDACVIWVVRAPYSELVANNPSIDRILVVSCMTEWIELQGRAVFDKMFDLHIPARVCPVCLIPLEKSKGNPQITLENYFEFGNLLSVQCQTAGLAVFDDQPRVYIPESAIHAVDILSLPLTFVAIHCRSNERSKDWEKDKWRQLAIWLAKQCISCIEVGTMPILASDPTPTYINLCGRLSILETAEVIRRSAMFIGVDSGPAHLANAVGTFGIVLMGHYRRFKRTMPYSGRYCRDENAEIVFADGPAASLSVDKVIAAAMRHLTGFESVRRT